MSRYSITCPSCGYQYEPNGQSSCSLCPLHSRCAQDDPVDARMVCCPNCGTQTVNPHASSWARWAARIFGGKQNDKISI